MRMSKIKEFPRLVAGLRPDGFRNVGYRIAAVFPGGEDADFRFPLGTDGTFQKANARMAAAGIRQDEQPRLLILLCGLRRSDLEPLNGCTDISGGQASGGGHLDW